MANLGRFQNLLTDYEAANRLGGRSIKWREDLNGLCLFMNTYATEAYGEQQPPSDDIRNINAIQIMSIHQAKGLEWPVVFVPALVRQRFPTSRVGEQKFWCDIPRDMFDAKKIAIQEVRGQEATRDICSLKKFRIHRHMALL
jgi:DNA helicase II / ATP-dependent DNA helicase PcrA